MKPKRAAFKAVTQICSILVNYLQNKINPLLTQGAITDLDPCRIAYENGWRRFWRPTLELQESGVNYVLLEESWVWRQIWRKAFGMLFRCCSGLVGRPDSPSQDADKPEMIIQNAKRECQRCHTQIPIICNSSSHDSPLVMNQLFW